MSRRFDSVVPLHTRGSVTHSDLEISGNVTEIEVQPATPEALQDIVGLRIEQMMYSSENCSRLLRHIDAACTPLLRDLDVSMTGSYTSLYYHHNFEEEEAARARSLEEWRSWFNVNGVPRHGAVSNIRNLNVSGYVYARSDTDWSVFDIVLALFARMPRLRTIDLSITGLARAPRPEVDFQTSLPAFNEMQELTIGSCSLKFLHALLKKMGRRFKTLNISGNLHPGVREGPGTIDGHEDPGDRASVGSSSRASTSAYYMRPVDLVEVLRDLSSISETNVGLLSLKELAIIPGTDFRHKKQAMRVAQAASLVIKMPFLSRLHTLSLDRFTFSSLCAYADLYLAGNPLPSTLRNFTLVLSRWLLRDGDADVYGEGHTRIGQSFGVLAKQIERGDARKLRKIQVTMRESSSELAIGLLEIEEDGFLKDLVMTCRTWRIRLRVKAEECGG